MDNSVKMVIPGLRGGGAERVAMLLTNEFQSNEYKAQMLLTHDMPEYVVQNELNDEVELLYLQNEVKRPIAKRLLYMCIGLISRFLCGITEKTGHQVPARMAYLSFIWQYYGEIMALRKILIDNPEASVIAFLQPSVPIILLAARGLPNNIIISERGDPQRLMKKRYGGKFLEKYYKRADHIVFQTEDAKNTYPKILRNKGLVIYNPIKADLPEPYDGERNKIITTFCRISKQKNLTLLIEAFSLLHKEYSDYELHIIGMAQNGADKEEFHKLKNLVDVLGIQNKVVWLPFSKDVHRMILKDAMYVNSSDYEGMSNSMLEAMAIGLPTICTDCPIGGARAIIKDHYNGILTPIEDREALTQAMIEVIENPELAVKISRNAQNLRYELSVEHIVERWLEIL